MSVRDVSGSLGCTLKPMKTTINFVPPCDNGICIVEVVENDGIFDIFDVNTGVCLNEGCAFPFRPSVDEIKEFINTGEITGKIKKINPDYAFNLVIYKCGCVGLPPAKNGKAVIFQFCDSDDGPKFGMAYRDMGDKTFVPACEALVGKVFIEISALVRDGHKLATIKGLLK